MHIIMNQVPIFKTECGLGRGELVCEKELLL